MLIEKEVIRPGTYWYREESTGLPRKLTVTPELTQYWHEQGNAMLSSGLTVPVPFEHDFDAHPMSPADKLKNNAGWVTEYTVRDNKLFAQVDVQDVDVAKKLPGTIRWTSPWINSFTDGNGKEWKNVISHLALTTRPRIVEQEPFGSVAAALSMASESVVWIPDHDNVKPKGCTCPNYPEEKLRNGSGHLPECPYHQSWLAQGGFGKGMSLSNAGLIVGDEPAFPMAFSMWSNGMALGNTAHDTKTGQFTGSGKGKSGKKSAPKLKSKHQAATDTAEKASKKAAKSGSKEHHEEAQGHHTNAAEIHEKEAQRWRGSSADSAHDLYTHHTNMAKKHRSAAESHRSSGSRVGGAPKESSSTEKNRAAWGDPNFRMAIDDDEQESFDDDSELNEEPDGDKEDDDTIDLPPLGDPKGDVSTTEILCDLLGALGIQCQHDGDEAMFKRNLYNAAMTKIHELTGKGSNGDANQQKPNRTNPPGQPPNNQTPKQPGQQNPIIQQEQQPMYMSLEEINKLPDPLRGVALALYNDNQKIRKQAAADRKKLDSLNAAKLADEDGKRQQRVALIGKLMPRVKSDLDAMLTSPSFALSMGEGGRVVDPMAQTLAMLEKGLADLPTAIITDQSALSVHPQPTDADMLDTERIDKIADDFARMMGCAPEKKAS